MFWFRSLVFAGATSLAAALAPVCSASAAPPAMPGGMIADPQVQPAGYACNAYSCWRYGLYYNPVYRPYPSYYPPYGAPLYGPNAYRPPYAYRPYAYRPYRAYRPYALYYRPYAPYYRPYPPNYRQYYRVYETPYYGAYGRYDW
jgi:hypothetical protein